MKAVLVLALFAVLSVASATELQSLETVEHEGLDEFNSLIELANTIQQAPDLMAAGDAAALATYLPDSGPYDNPATDVTPTATIPSSPTCTIRGQTIFEIRKMRADAKQIGMSIMYEIQVMEKRKAYIEQMTAYLNDRIRELNKVKRDLAAEQKWVQVSNQRIAELAQKEKLIKLQDVMSCIKTEQERLNGEKGTKTQALDGMTKQAAALEANIKAIRAKMETTTNAADGVPPGLSAAGAPGAPPPAGAPPAS